MRLGFIFLSLFFIDLSLENRDSYFSSNRYYDPKLGRFIQMDTVVPSTDSVGLNRMTYANNCPLKFTDPSGHVPQDLTSDGW